MKKFLIPVIILLIISACTSDNNPVTPVEEASTGIFVINEGAFGKNNSSISYYDFLSMKIQNDVYYNANNSTNLGDNANDGVIYKNILYVVVSNSNKVETIDSKTFKKLGIIDLGQNASPREICIIDEKTAYVTCYGEGGTVKKLDLQSLKVLSTIKVGANPESIVTSKNKLFVSNSGWGSGRTVSVIDIATDKLINSLVVGYNPNELVLDNSGKVYVICLGGWTKEQAVKGIYKIEPTQIKVVDSLKIDVNFPGDACVANNKMMLVDAAGIVPVNLETFKVESLLIPTSKVVTGSGGYSTIYGISFDKTKQKIYCGNPKDMNQNGEIVEFDLSGQETKRFECGINPGTIIIK